MSDRLPSYYLLPPQDRPFGEPIAGLDYQPRPGAYAVAIEDGRVLVVDEESGLFLPGGGIEPDESPIEALHREVMEETGFAITHASPLARLRQFAISRGSGKAYDKDCHVFEVTLSQALRVGDCSTHWIELEIAENELAHEAFQWVIRRLRNGSQSR
jgi:8-oxo-dGTP diphosphatase